VEKSKSSPGNAIAAIVGKIPEIHGWHSLNRQEQDSLVSYTSDLHQYIQLTGLGEFGQLIVLTQVQQLIDGKDVDMLEYLAFNYPTKHPRTIFRKQQAYAELAATIPNALLKRLSAFGQDVIGSFGRIASASLGDIRSAIREMPMLSVKSDVDPNEWLVKLDGKLLEERQNRRKATPEPNQDFIENIAANELSNHIIQAKLETSAEKRQFLTRVLGWAMEYQAVTGTVSTGRIPIPDAMRIFRGRPKIAKKSKIQKERQKKKRAA